jgi:hypothetical protein
LFWSDATLRTCPVGRFASPGSSPILARLQALYTPFTCRLQAGAADEKSLTRTANLLSDSSDYPSTTAQSCQSNSLEMCHGKT